ncbi:hypothetical protein ACA910_012151 [Epithemia clementina (nom. ined.)]
MTKSLNLYNFWVKSLVVNSYLSDLKFCVVASTTTDGGNDSNHDNSNHNNNHHPVKKAVGFAFGEMIEKWCSLWKYGVVGLCVMIDMQQQQNDERTLCFSSNLCFGHDKEHVYLCNNSNDCP